MYWLDSAGRVIVDGSGAPEDCPTCPCGAYQTPLPCCPLLTFPEFLCGTINDPTNVLGCGANGTRLTWRFLSSGSLGYGYCLQTPVTFCGYTYTGNGWGSLGFIGYDTVGRPLSPCVFTLNDGNVLHGFNSPLVNMPCGFPMTLTGVTLVNNPSTFSITFSSGSCP